jgi:hypothetical protein
MEPAVGVEPTTLGLRYRCSTTELSRPQKGQSTIGEKPCQVRPAHGLIAGRKRGAAACFHWRLGRHPLSIALCWLPSSQDSHRRQALPGRQSRLFPARRTGWGVTRIPVGKIGGGQTRNGISAGSGFFRPTPRSPWSNQRALSRQDRTPQRALRNGPTEASAHFGRRHRPGPRRGR